MTTFPLVVPAVQAKKQHTGLKFACLYTIQGEKCVTTSAQTLKHNILRHAAVDNFCLKVHLMPGFCNVQGTVVIDGRFNDKSTL